MTAWNLSCPDWKERLRTGKSLVPTLPLFPDGDRAVAIFNKLRLFDVPGTPTMAEAGADWFRDIVRALFGSYDAATKTRMIRELFLLVSKKQNKTTGGALLMLTALLMNERPRAPFLLTGPFQKTADDAFAAAAGAIALDDVLAKKLHVRDHVKTIIHRETQAKLEILTFDPDIVTGKKVVGALIDEQHVLGKNARAGKSMIQLRGGMVPFPEAFLAVITTQSDEAPAGVFKQDLTRAREIRDGKREGRVLPVMYEFPREMQQDPAKPWRDPANWHMVTPNLGLSIQMNTLIEACDEEESKGEQELRTWASQHLNVEIGVAMQSDRWSGADFWEQQSAPGMTLDEILSLSDCIIVGLDGGGLDDLLGLAVLGRDKVTGDWLHWGRSWAHPLALERRKSEESRYRDFEADGDLEIVDALPDDVSGAVAIVKQIHEAGLLAGVGMDPERTHKVLKAALEEAGIPEELMAGVSQGWRLFGAMTVAERKLAEGTFWHCAQPLLAWSIGNCKTEPKGNAMLITKQVSGRAKIDPVMAMLNAVELMARNPAPVKKKYQMLFV